MTPEHEPNRTPASLVLAGHINHPQLPELTRRFLLDQLNKNSDIMSNDIDLEDCPMISVATGSALSR